MARLKLLSVFSFSLNYLTNERRSYFQQSIALSRGLKKVSKVFEKVVYLKSHGVVGHYVELRYLD